MCMAHVPFHGMLSHEIPAKTLLASNAWVFTLSLTITEPLQQIPITNTVWINYNQIWHGIKANTIHICKLQLYKLLISFSLWDLHLVSSYSKNIKNKVGRNIGTGLCKYQDHQDYWPIIHDKLKNLFTTITQISRFLPQIFMCIQNKLSS